MAEKKILRCANSKESQQVKYIFERFIALGSIAMLARELNNQGYRTKSYVSQMGNRQGGKVFSLQALPTILKNRLYLAKVHHICFARYALNAPISQGYSIHFRWKPARWLWLILY
jgi:hypothetical protein